MTIDSSVATGPLANNDEDIRARLTAGIQVVVVLGSTATGKTSLSVFLGQSTSGEVVNADSRYFYRGMDIGTAKPSLGERGGVPHHLIDIRDPHEGYSLGMYLNDAYRAIEDVGRRGKLPIVAGGTPQYLRALIEGWTVPEVEPDWDRRAELELESVGALYERLQKIDPTGAERADPHNKRRLIRAIEIFEQTGRPMSEVARQSPPPYRFFIVGLRQERGVLYPRIDRRVTEMYAAGWLDEVRQLRDQGVTREMPAMSAHGYREALDVIEGRIEIEQAIRQTQIMIHRYVRHQTTWFRKFPGIHWYDSSVPSYEHAVLSDVRRFLEGSTAP